MKHFQDLQNPEALTQTLRMMASV